MVIPSDSALKFETVAEKDGLKLEMAYYLFSVLKTPHRCLFRLTNNDNKVLLKIGCDIPFDGKFYRIRTVSSAKPGNINFFARMIEMIRTDLRKMNPNADIVSSSEATPKMKEYYKKRLGAFRKMETDFIHFPEHLTNRTKHIR